MRHLPIILLAAGFFWTIPLDGQAQLLEVKQTVYGMDCAPCAYALEKRIGKLEGIATVSVSLNDGLLTAALTNENRLSLKQIRNAVEESGFSPKTAEIKLTGTLQKENDRYVIITPSGDKYAIKPQTGDTENRLENIRSGQTITLSGRIPQETPETGYWTLTVEEV